VPYGGPSCRSVKQAELTAEMLIHFPGLNNIDEPRVLLVPKVTVCLDRGSSRFTLSKPKLAYVAEHAPVDKATALEESAGDVAFGSGRGKLSSSLACTTTDIVLSGKDCVHSIK
jgi:hypothetical protein